MRKPIVLSTMLEVRNALEACHRTRSEARRAILQAAIDDARLRATEDCDGAAHSNPWIDNCGICAPFWGKVLPK